MDGFRKIKPKEEKFGGEDEEAREHELVASEVALLTTIGRERITIRPATIVASRFFVSSNERREDDEGRTRIRGSSVRRRARRDK